MQACGFLMLAGVAALMLATGLPAFVAMIGTASAFAVLGVLAGTIPFPLLSALPSRIVGLLETDLLQALPLFILMGGLLNRLPLADIVFRAFTRLAARSPAAPLLAGLGLGALLAPMNRSVGASVAMLVRVVRPRLASHGVPPATSLAAVCAASTLGVVVPPSLVLILFGDAMMRAHTEALNVTGQMTRVINTQDVFRGAMVPAGLLFVLYLLLAWWRGRHRARPAIDIRVSSLEWLAAAATVVSIGGLLGAVMFGYLYAVEAAAAGAVVLACIGFIHGELRGARLRELLADTMAVTGALFALFLAATSFTLVFRAFGSDRLLVALITGMPGGAIGAVMLVLATLAICALVLDAFEIILVIVPLLMPPLLMRAPDAVWDATLAILVLQGSFLIPPMGYAVMMARGFFKERIGTGEAVRALAPYLAAQLAVVALVIAVPRVVHLAGHDDAALKPVMSDDAARRQLLLMTTPEDEPQ